MRWTTLLLAATLAGCASAEPPTDWSLVGVYDASALVQAGLIGQEEGAGASTFHWVPSGGMRTSCGPAKAPDGLGLFEAEAMTSRLTPTLAVVLERNGDGEAPMTPEQVRVSLGIDDPTLGAKKPVFALQPAVMPRYISVRITGDAETRHKQVVRNQLRMELCMEHKTGRGWVGGNHTQLREAFLLDSPQEGAGIDRKYFGGQRDPVPALLGPPDACMQSYIEETKDKGLDVGRGDGSLSLVPSDVWGASLRLCDGRDEVGGVPYIGTKPIPLTLGATNEQPSRTTRGQWTELVANLKDAPDDSDIKVDLTWGDQPLLVDQPLMNQPTDDQGRPTGPPGVTDLLQRVPHTYPLVGTVADPTRYTVLLIPNWQIVEGLRRIDPKVPDPDAKPVPVAAATEPGAAKRVVPPWEKPELTGGTGIQDGVGFVIDHPEYLFVQLPPREGVDLGITKAEGDDSETWLNVAEPLAGGRFGLMRWGYSPGMLSGRSPIVLPGFDEPTWDQVKQAHNAELHGTFLLAGVVLLSLLWIGMQRLRDLWANLPEERVDFWPIGDGLPPEKDEAPAPKVPEAGG